MPAVPARVETSPDAEATRRRRAIRGELAIALAIALVLILLRSFVFLAYESFFDSDQAIVGLMAKHLAEGRAFPLFFYGQPYMLAVESWVAAPMLLVAGPSVAALRSVLILLNVAVAALLVVGLWRGAGLRPMYGLVASLFFVFAPPYTSGHLVEAMGGNIEPFLYLLVLWLIRDRPLWFGAVLAVGFLNREFSAYAVPVIVAGQAITGAAWRADTWRRWLVAFVAFLAVHGAIHAIKPYADLMGPGSRGATSAQTAGSQVDNLVVRTKIDLPDVPARLVAFSSRLFPIAIGGREASAGFASQGHDWMALPIAIAFGAALVRIGVVLRRAYVDRRREAAIGPGTVPPNPVQAASFAWYILGTGLVAAMVCIVTKPMQDLPLRYFLLAIYVPVGLTAGWLALEPRAAIRRAIVAGVVAWAAVSGVDHVREIQRYAALEGPDEIRVLADALVQRGVTVAEATYWRAYKLTYLTGERVKVSSSDYVRIDEYQKLANQEPRLVRIQETPCPNGERVARWYLCREE